MKDLKCPNCGAPINRATMRCDYCGAAFEHDTNLIIHQIENPKVIPLNTVMRVDNDIAMMDGYERYLVDHMAYSLAKQIVKYMDVTVQDDPMRNQVKTYARVRVVPPNVDIW